jgi:hypothetical protein
LNRIPSVFMYAMNIQNDVIGLVLRENCKSKQVTDFIAWPSRCHGRIHLFYHLILHCLPLKQFFADHLPIFFYKDGLTVGQKLFALWPPIRRSKKYVLTDLFCSFVTRLQCFLYTSHVLSVWYFSYLFLSICLL